MALLPPDEVAREVEGTGWAHSGSELVKVVKRSDFVSAMAVVNDIARAAEDLDHHPDIDIRWNTVTLRLSTHSAGGITEKDIALARRIDALL